MSRRWLTLLMLVPMALAPSGCGAPRENVPVSGQCDADSECADGRCHQGICLAASRLDNGVLCQSDGQCKSLSCQAGRCAANTRALGERCLAAEECASLSCVDNKCSTAAPCGDRIVNGVEQCDGAALGGASCASQGFDGGELSCDASCRFDTSGCAAHDWVTIKAGSFTMGSPTSEVERDVNETAHQVTLTRDFAITPTEVTQRQYEKVRRYNPAAHRDGVCERGDCPVENVSWSEAAAYCNALSDAQGLSACYRCEAAGKAVRCAPAPDYAGAAIYRCPGYRLPTDAEWEHAYRAGTSTPYYDGLSAGEIGWHNDNSSGPQPVGQKKPNNASLYDMGGNVWEWCNDRFVQDLGSDAVTDPAGAASGDYRVTRGGSWRFEPSRLRGASRLLNLPSKRQDDLGFRCARTIAP